MIKEFQNSAENKIQKALQMIEKSDIVLNINNSMNVRTCLENVSNQEIINSVGMADMPLIIYLLSLKYGENPQLIPIENDLMIRVGDCNAANMSYLAVYIHFLKFEDGHLTIEGNVSYPTAIGKCALGAWVNGQPVLGIMKDMDLDLKKGRNVYETRAAYKLEIKLDNDIEIVFFNEIDGIKVAYGRINSMRFSPIADCIPGQYYEKDGWIFYIDGRRLQCKKSTLKEIESRERKFREGIKRLFPQKYEWAIKLRDFYFDFKKEEKRPIWLFMDRADRAEDNAKILFKYVQSKTEIDSYFLLSKDSKDFEEMQKIGKVIPLYSEEHFKKFLVAEYIISSQCNGVIENPFWEDGELFRDLYHRPKIIFLQHGVIKDDMSLTLNRYNTNFTGFVTSTKEEYESILTYPYQYTNREVWLTGLPRFDELYDKREKLILIIPSWRKGLMEQIWNEQAHNMVWEVTNELEKTEFFEKYTSLIQNKKLMDICKKNKYKILFAAHPLMRGQMKQAFSSFDNSEQLELVDSETSYKELFAKASIMVTDYSSVAFDFAFLKKPIVYYQFDKEKFFKEHTYRQGYFQYEKDGFGEVCMEEEQLVDTLVDYIEKDCIMKNIYKQRMNRLYEKENNFCESVFNKILESRGKKEMFFTNSEYKLVEMKQFENKVLVTIELEAAPDIKEVYLNNYFEGLYIGIGETKYNVYAEIQGNCIVGEILYDVVANNATEKKDKLNRLWIRNRVGNTYIEQPVFIRCKEMKFSFGHNKNYVFTPANSLEWYFCPYTNEIKGENPFDHDDLEKNVKQISDVRFEVQEKSVFVYGNISNFLNKVNEVDVIEERDAEFCLAWKEVKNKKNYYFHSENMKDGRFVYQLTEEEINQFGKCDIEGKVFEWIAVDSKGQEYRLSPIDSEEIENIEIPAKDFCTEMSRTNNNTVQMRTLSSIYFNYLDVSENGNEMIVEFKKKTYDLTLESVIAQKVNTDIEYQLPFSIISESKDKIIYSIKLQMDVDEEEFKIGIHQFWIEVRDGIFTERYPMRLLRKRKLTENTYLIAKHPYAVISNNYYNCLFYNDSSNNLKCNIMRKIMRMQIIKTEVLSDKIKLGVSVKKEPFFEKVTNVKMVAGNSEEIWLDYTVSGNLSENRVDIEMPLEKMDDFGPNSLFRVEMSFEGRSASVRLENNMYRPAVNNRETRSFCSIQKNSNGVFRRIWGNHVKGSYAVGASENLQLLCEKGTWIYEDKFFVRVGWVDETFLETYKDMQVSLYLRNKITEEEIKFEIVEQTSEDEDKDETLFFVSTESLPEAEFVVYAELESGMKTYLEMTSASITLPLYKEKKKVQLKKTEEYLEVSVEELLLFEDELRVKECNEIIQKAREENKQSNRKIWLIGENLGLSARDNGLAFFEYCMKNKSEIQAEVYFVTKEENKDKKYLEQYSENVLIYDSPDHIYYDELAEFYIVSHGVRDVMPSLYHNKTGVYHKPVIYLQHGIAAMKKFGISNRSYGGSIRKFIVSSEQEKELLVDNNQFWEDEIANTGLSRYDKLLSKDSVSGKYIWIMPTWRDWLVKSEKEFINSEFYAYYSSILGDTELIEALREKEQKLVFSLHVEFEKYKPYFDKFGNDVVHITDMHEENITKRIEECSMIVTDYSSIIFDVVYQNKPVIFFQFDQNTYNKYRSSYVDLEKDLPGTVTHNVEELKEELILQIKNEFETSLECKKKAGHYFDYHDCNNSERIYNVIMECREEMADEYQY